MTQELNTENKQYTKPVISKFNVNVEISTYEDIERLQRLCNELLQALNTDE